MARRKSIMGVFKCPQCTRKFSMKAHLQRHLNTIHSSPEARAQASARRASQASTPGRRSAGRPSAIVTKLGLRGMSLEQLKEVIDAAKSEAQVRLAEMQQTFV
jgi:uncharacterized C2H2 Zn-finger protein